MYCSDDLRINRVDHPMILKSKDPFLMLDIMSDIHVPDYNKIGIKLELNF